MRGLKDKVAIVTASTDGIGFAIAQRLLEEGCKVTVSSRKLPNVEKAVAELKSKGFKNVIGVPCHVANKDQIKDMVEKTVKAFGTVDILVSNAGVSPVPGPILGSDDVQWDKIFEINVKAAWYLTRACKPYLKSGSSILFVSSVAGFRPVPPIGLYGVSKTALFGLTKSLALELGPENIRVNCLAPGTIVTKMSEMLTEEGELSKSILAQISLGRFGQSHEMASTVAFLCSDEASYVTGEILVAAGGMPAHL